MVWVAVIDDSGGLVADRIDRLELETSELSLPRSLSEFEETVEHLLRRLVARELVLVRAGSSQRHQAANDYRRRGWIEGVLMIAAHRTGVTFSDVTHDRIEGAFGVRPSDPSFSKIMSEHLAVRTPARWKERAPAFAAASLAAGIR